MTICPKFSILKKGKTNIGGLPGKHTVGYWFLLSPYGSSPTNAQQRTNLVLLKVHLLVIISNRLTQKIFVPFLWRYKLYFVSRLKIVTQNRPFHMVLKKFKFWKVTENIIQVIRSKSEKFVKVIDLAIFPLCWPFSVFPKLCCDLKGRFGHIKKLK